MLSLAIRTGNVGVTRELVGAALAPLLGRWEGIRRARAEAAVTFAAMLIEEACGRETLFAEEASAFRLLQAAAARERVVAEEASGRGAIKKEEGQEFDGILKAKRDLNKSPRTLWLESMSCGAPPRFGGFSFLAMDVEYGVSALRNNYEMAPVAEPVASQKDLSGTRNSYRSSCSAGAASEALEILSASCGCDGAHPAAIAAFSNEPRLLALLMGALSEALLAMPVAALDADPESIDDVGVHETHSYFPPRPWQCRLLNAADFCAPLPAISSPPLPVSVAALSQRSYSALKSPPTTLFGLPLPHLSPFNAATDAAVETRRAALLRASTVALLNDRRFGGYPCLYTAASFGFGGVLTTILSFAAGVRVHGDAVLALSSAFSQTTDASGGDFSPREGEPSTSTIEAMVQPTSSQNVTAATDSAAFASAIANIAHESNPNYTALYIASQMGRVDMARALLLTPAFRDSIAVDHISAQRPKSRGAKGPHPHFDPLHALFLRGGVPPNFSESGSASDSAALMMTAIDLKIRTNRLRRMSVRMKQKRKKNIQTRMQAAVPHPC